MSKAIKYTAYIGCIGMLLTGHWAWKNDVIFTFSALLTAPHIIGIGLSAMKGQQHDE